MATVALDCDGVLLDLLTHVLDWLGNPIQQSEIHTWSMFDVLPRRDAKRARSLLSSGWFWKAAPCMPGAQTAVHRLREAGHEIYVVTRVWRGCYGWGEERYRWLQRHYDIPEDNVAIMAAKAKFPADVFVDDKPAHIMDWQRANPHGRAYWMPHPGQAHAELWSRQLQWTDDQAFTRFLLDLS